MRTRRAGRGLLYDLPQPSISKKRALKPLRSKIDRFRIFQQICLKNFQQLFDLVQEMLCKGNYRPLLLYLKDLIDTVVLIFTLQNNVEWKFTDFVLLKMV